MITVETVALPDFGAADALPPIAVGTYLARLKRVEQRMAERQLDLLVVYADREHSANLAYLTGFDPRFEEALLVLGRDHSRHLLVGNECMGYLPDLAALGLRVECFQAFSLLGQPRGASRPLRGILREQGCRPGAKVGCVGWKYDAEGLCGAPGQAIELPAYLVDLLRELAGGAAAVVNATDLFMHPREGLRITAEPDQIAQFEYAATTTSQGVLALLRHLQPGVREQELERHLDARGLPLSCHRMVSFGDKARRGLASAGGARAELGAAFTTALGVTGALTARAGVIAAGAHQLPASLAAFYEAFVANYFATVAAWYEALAVGRPAGEVVAAVEAVRDPRLFQLALNPGHYLHLDEWVHSPFVPGSTIPLASGMVLQADLIPISQGPFCCSNLEDGIVLADSELREELGRRYPPLMARIRHRRAFMSDILGLHLDASVLPLGNIPGWLPPYALRLDQALVKP